MHAAICPAQDEPVTMSRRALDAVMWLSHRLGEPCYTIDKTGAFGWHVNGHGSEPEDDDAEPPEYVEIRTAGGAPVVDVMVFSDLAYVIIGYCVTHGIQHRDSEAIIAGLQAEEAAEGAPKAAVKH